MQQNDIRQDEPENAAPIERAGDFRAVGWRLVFYTMVVNLGAVLLAVAVITPVIVSQVMPALMDEIAKSGELTVDFLQNRYMDIVMGSLADSGELYMVVIAGAQLAAVLLGLTVMLPLIKRRVRPIRAALSLKGISRETALLAFGACFGLNLLAGLVSSLTEMLFNQFGYTTVIDLQLTGGGAWYMGLMLAYVVFVGPFCEEVVYRHAVCGTLKRYGARFAMVASAVIFALMHGNLAQLPIGIVVGLALGYVYLRTDSLGLCVLIHMANNLIAVALELATPLMSEAASTTVELALVVVGGAAGVICMKKLAAKLGPVGEDSEGGLCARLFSKLPMVLFTAYCLYMVIVMVQPLA